MTAINAQLLTDSQPQLPYRETKDTNAKPSTTDSTDILLTPGAHFLVRNNSQGQPRPANRRARLYLPETGALAAEIVKSEYMRTETYKVLFIPIINIPVLSYLSTYVKPTGKRESTHEPHTKTRERINHSGFQAT